MESLVDNSDIFASVYKARRVLVTGHTGFKGSWLCLWLLKLKANVAGFSLYLPSEPCHFEVLNLRERIMHYEGDIRNIYELENVFEDFCPQIVFHLAAQPIVWRSYEKPKLTFDTNVGGTVNVLECIKVSPSVQAAVIITSDKCYQNVEWEWGYRENDALGGDDPYSASKACAEIACRAYAKSYFMNEESPNIATARAGNIIGGGDWAQDRAVPDCIKALTQGKKPAIRHPEATRPWQHVLEPLSGYLWLGANLIEKPEDVASEAFNFGPDGKVNKSVRELADLFLEFWGQGGWENIPAEYERKESTLLKLCCDKALHRLGWHCVLSFKEAVRLTAEWYKNYYNNNNSYDFSCSQIDYYLKKAIEQDLPWSRNNIIENSDFLEEKIPYVWNLKHG